MKLILFKEKNSKLQKYWWHRAIVVLFWACFILGVILLSLGFINFYVNAKQSKCVDEILSPHMEPRVNNIDFILNTNGQQAKLRQQALITCARWYNCYSPIILAEVLPTSLLLSYLAFLLAQWFYFKILLRIISYIVFNNSDKIFVK